VCAGGGKGQKRVQGEKKFCKKGDGTQAGLLMIGVCCHKLHLALGEPHNISKGILKMLSAGTDPKLEV